MTDRDTKLRAVAARFLGWEPGKMCTGCLDPNGHAFTGKDEDGLPVITSHEIPPPDPRDPAVRVALEDALLKISPKIVWGWTYCIVRPSSDETYVGNGDYPADALLDAAYRVVAASRSDG